MSADKIFAGLSDALIGRTTLSFAKNMVIAPSDLLDAASRYAFVDEIRTTYIHKSEEFSYVMLKACRMGISQADIAEEFSVTKGAVSKWCSGLTQPSNYIRLRVLQWVANEIENTVIIERARVQPLINIVVEAFEHA